MSGTAYNIITEQLLKTLQFRRYLSREISPRDYFRWVNDQGGYQRICLNEDQLGLSTRLPRDWRDFVRFVLKEADRRGIVASDEAYTEDFLQLFQQVDLSFDHSGRMTYIFPEEAHILYAIARTAKPKRGVFMGSYYGYWAIWAKAALLDTCEVTLIDIDPNVMEIARRNFSAFGLNTKVTYIIDDAIEAVKNIEDIDLLVLDAEGPKDPMLDLDFQDKAIYYPMLKAALPGLSSEAILVAHNVLLDNVSGIDYFERKISYNRCQYQKFIPLAMSVFYTMNIESTEGMIIGKRR